MKTWLKGVWRFLTKPCVSVLELLVLAVLFGLLGGFAYDLGSWAKERELAEQCALCTSHGMVQRYPCLVKLETGESGQIQVYAITDGAAYDIRGYAVEVSKAENGQTITVTKYLE